MPGQPSTTQPRRKPPLRYFVLSLLCVFLLTWGSLMVRASRAVRTQIDAVRAAGYPLTVEEMRAYHPEPTGPHAGAVYLQAEEAMVGIGWNKFPIGVPFFDYGDTYGSPGRPDPLPFRGDPWPKETLELSELLLRDNAEAMRLTREASEMGPAWFRRWYHEPPELEPFDYVFLRNASRLFQLQAATSAKRGANDQAFEAVTCTT